MLIQFTLTPEQLAAVEPLATAAELSPEQYVEARVQDVLNGYVREARREEELRVVDAFAKAPEQDRAAVLAALKINGAKEER